MEEKSKQLEFEEGMQIGKKWGKAKKKEEAIWSEEPFSDLKSGGDKSGCP